MSCLGKLFTAILNTRINAFLENSGLLGAEQAGFRSGYSTIDHIYFLHSLLDMYLEKRKRIYCAFLDFRKAFDSIRYRLLVAKLHVYGIADNVCEWIEEFRRQRATRISVCEAVTGEAHACVGVPQGSMLGPLLLLIFTNDVTIGVDSS